MCLFGTWAVFGRSALQELQRQWSWTRVWGYKLHLWPSSAALAHVKASRVHLCRLFRDLEMLQDCVPCFLGPSGVLMHA